MACLGNPACTANMVFADDAGILQNDSSLSGVRYKFDLELHLVSTLSARCLNGVPTVLWRCLPEVSSLVLRHRSPG